MKLVRYAAAAIALLAFAQALNADAFSTKRSGNAVDITIWKGEHAGTITIESGSTQVVGVGTEFTKIFLPAPGFANITDADGAVRFGAVASIQDNTHLTLLAPAAAPYAGAYTTESLPTLSDDLTVNADHSISASSADIGSTAFGVHDLTLNGALTTDVIYLQITGDLTMNTGGSLSAIPDTRLVFDGVSTIGGTAPIIIDHLRIKAPGVVTLAKDVAVARILEMEGGTIVTGAFTLTLGTSSASPGSFVHTGTGPESNGIVDGTLRRWIASDPIAMGDARGMFPMGSGADLRRAWIAKAGAGAGTVTVTHANGSDVTYLSIPFQESSVTFDRRHDMHWTIVPGDGYAGLTDLRLQKSGCDAALLPFDLLTVSLAESPAAGGYAPSSIVGSDTVANRTGLDETGLSNTFYIATGFTSMPVELTAFTAAAQGSAIVLQWNTATELGNTGFEIERSPSASAREWMKIGFVAGHGTTNAPQSYTFADRDAKGGAFAYRLKQIDADGRSRYSREIEAGSAMQASGYGLGQNYPNPFNPTTAIRFSLDRTERAVVKVYNALGQEISTLFDGIAEANTVHTVVFDAQRLASGMYFYSLRAGSRTDVKKMQLVR